MPGNATFTVAQCPDKEIAIFAKASFRALSIEYGSLDDNARLLGISYETIKRWRNDYWPTQPPLWAWMLLEREIRERGQNG